MEILFLIGRFIFGGFFLMNGINHFKHKTMLSGYAKSKGYNSGDTIVVVTGIMLTLGGLGMITGTFVQVALALLALFLIGTSFAMHAFWNESDPERRSGEMINFTKNIALLGAILMMFIFPGPWPLSLF